MSHVVIVGGGHNALVCAAYLARSGKQVTVLEARAELGGVAAPYELHEGYVVPGLVHDSDGFSQDIVRDLDLISHGLLLTPAPPVYLPKAGERGVVLHTDPMAAVSEIEAHSPSDVQGYQEFRKFCQKVSPLINKLLTREPPDVQDDGMGQIWQIMGLGMSLRRLGGDIMMDMMRIPSMPVADWLDEYFESPLLKAALAMGAIQTTFAGPRSPGTAANLIFKECSAGAAIKGGPCGVVGALASACEAHGVALRTSSPVARIEPGVVTLVDGSAIEADSVVSACHPATTFLDLVPPEHVPPTLVHEMRHLRSRGIIGRVDLALNQKVSWAGRPGERFDRVRIAPSMNALEQAFDATKYNELPESYCLDVSVPTVLTPSLAPDGTDVVSVMVHFVPQQPQAGWTTELREMLMSRVIEQLVEHAPDIGQQIVAKQLLVPQDLERQYGLRGGHLYQVEHALDQLLFLRPSPSCLKHRTPLPGVFLCGSGTHPGGGISGLCGRLAADAVLKG